VNYSPLGMPLYSVTKCNHEQIDATVRKNTALFVAKKMKSELAELTEQ
jgi:hypothetical protein